MLECEIKLFDIDKDRIEKQLQRIWATCKKSTLIVDIYIKSSDKKLMRSRIRCTSSDTLLTCKYKLPTTTTKQAYELDIPLSYDYQIHEQQRSWIVDHVRVKKRTTYERGWYLFDIDEYIWLPPILEIEWPDETSIQRVIMLLWWDHYTQSTCGGKWVYQYYNTELPDITHSCIWRLLSLIRCW